MTEPPSFDDRITAVRARFVERMPARFRDMETLAGEAGREDDPAAAREALEELYRHCHDIAGIASIIGLGRTGTAARGVEAVVARARREKRALAPREHDALKLALETLTDAFGRDQGALSSAARP